MASLGGKRIGFALCGSHCSFDQVFPEIGKLVETGAEVFPVLSAAAVSTDTRFGSAAQLVEKLTQFTRHQPMTELTQVEPIGPGGTLDALVIAPCTGNTLAKLALAITDSAPLMAAKAMFRNGRPVVVAISTNDALGANAKNVGILLNMKNVYMVPFGQDNPESKPTSMMADMKMIIPTLVMALEGKQIQPVLVERRH
ncbi:MAG: dipicolinate synthase subunit B [Firmicutes bacterium]|nr:dipicolinate synthase subunit B [Bacillota bacterium]